MKAIIVSGGHADIGFVKEYIAKEDYDYLIAADKGLEVTDRLALTPDLIIGDFDSVDEKLIRRYETDPKSAESIMKFKPDKDLTDTHLAVERAVKMGYDEIDILCATGDRIDHMLGNVAVLLYALENDSSAAMIDENNRIRMTDSKMTILRQEQHGKYVSVFPYGGQASGVTLKGFKYPLSDGVLAINESLGVSNEIVADVASLEVERGILLVVESDR